MNNGIRVGPAAPEDAAEIGRLIRLQYGDLNADTVLYDPAALAEAIRAKQYHFIAASDEAGKVIGAICVKPSRFKSCAEVCTLTVLPEYRGKGLGKALLGAAMLAAPVIEGHTAFYYYALTLDTMTQKWGCDNGLVPCGLLPNRFKFDPAARNLAGLELPERRSHLVMARAAKKRDSGFLYVPEALKAYIQGVYADLGVKSEKACGNFADPAIFDYPVHDYADLIGDLPKETPRRESLNLFLNMNKADCPEQYEEAKRLGFMFMGVQPLTESGEYLIMHRSPRAVTAIKGIRTEKRFDERKKFILNLSE